MTHVAFDLALGTTGFAYPGGSDILVCPNGLTGGARLAWWATALTRAMRPHYVYGLEVVVEAPIIHEHNRDGAIPGLKLHGICEFAAYNLGAGTRYCGVANMTLKSYAKKAGAFCEDGKGLPSKEAMVALAATLGCVDVRDDNEADAYLLYCYWSDRAVTRGRSAPVIGGGR